MIIQSRGSNGYLSLICSLIATPSQSGTVHSRKVVNNIYTYIYILMRTRKTNAPQRWHQVLLADVEQWLLGCLRSPSWKPNALKRGHVVFLAEVEEPLVRSGAWTVWWSITGGYELYWFCGYLLFVTVAIVFWLQIREGSKMMICYHTSIIFRTWWMVEGHF